MSELISQLSYRTYLEYSSLKQNVFGVVENILTSEEIETIIKTIRSKWSHTSGVLEYKQTYYTLSNEPTDFAMIQNNWFHGRLRGDYVYGDKNWDTRIEQLTYFFHQSGQLYIRHYVPDNAKLDALVQLVDAVGKTTDVATVPKRQYNGRNWLFKVWISELTNLRNSAVIKSYRRIMSLFPELDNVQLSREDSYQVNCGGGTDDFVDEYVPNDSLTLSELVSNEYPLHYADEIFKVVLLVIGEHYDIAHDEELRVKIGNIISEESQARN